MPNSTTPRRTGTRLRQEQGKINFLSKFHKLIQKSASHYTLDRDSSERSMLKYYEYLQGIRSLLLDGCGVAVLANLEDFPVDLDPSLREYHEKIAARIGAVSSVRPDTVTRDRYFIHKTRPFFADGRIYYEVAFYRAVNKVSKFDRIIAFTDIDITDKHAAMLTLRRDSARRCRSRSSTNGRFRSARVSSTTSRASWGITAKIRTNSAKYQYLMRG